LKLHTKTNTIERGGVYAENAFTIKTTAKAFDILSSGLYTDPIAAIVRELSCNASDAHVAAGKPTEPFIIHLPNELEPYFSVIDNGTGLSDENIRGELVPTTTVEGDRIVPMLDEEGNQLYHRAGGLYTTYFESTKTDSNDFVGALGLGSKSPFSYARAFDVISRYNGTKLVYSVFLNESNIPSVALLGKKSTDEPNGLEVRIAIRSEDFSAFAEKVSHELRFFDIKPNIIGSCNFEFVDTPEPIVSGEGWSLFRSSRWGSNHVTAIQGNVAYHVNTDQLYSHLSDSARALIGDVDIALFFDIGQLEFAANREEIRYDEDTLSNIIDRLEQMCSDLTKYANDIISPYSDSRWNAAIAFESLSKEWFLGDHNLRIFLSHKTKELEDDSVLKDLVVKGNYVQINNDIRGHEIVEYTYRARGRITREGRVENTSVNPRSDTVVFYNDIKTRGITQIKEYLRNSQEINTALVITPLKIPRAVNTFNEAYETPFTDYDEEYEYIIDSLGHPEVKIASIDTETVKRKIGNGTKAPIYIPNGYHSVRRGMWDTTYTADWKTAELGSVYDSTDEFLWFLLEHRSNIIDDEGGTVYWESRSISDNIANMVNIINEHFGTNYEMDNVYGVSVTAQRKISKKSNWTNLFELYLSALESYSPTLEYMQIKNVTTDNDNFGILAMLEDSQARSKILGLDRSSPFRQAVEPAITSIVEHEGNVSAARKVLSIWNSQRIFDTHVPNDVAPFFEKGQFNKYEMLPVVGNYTRNIDKIINYINLIDRS